MGVPKNMWAIVSGQNAASIRVPIGGKMMHLPLILASRADARLVMKTYPELAAKNKIEKRPNRLGV